MSIDPLKSGAFVGIDNGVSGSIGFILNRTQYNQIPTPTFSQLNYTKAKRQITRIHYQKLKRILRTINPVMIVIERPMVNPGRFQATASALRALECTLVAIETLKLAYCYADSREWQKILLPSGIQGAPELKKASMSIGLRLFPMAKEAILKQKDADGLLLAEFCRLKYVNS